MATLADRPACYRCDASLDNTHRIQLSSTHEGKCTDRFDDVDRRICLDCLAAIGMLEFADASPDRGEPTSSLPNRLFPAPLS